MPKHSAPLNAHVSLPPFREAFPESLLRAEPHPEPNMSPLRRHGLLSNPSRGNGSYNIPKSLATGQHYARTVPIFPKPPGLSHRHPAREPPAGTYTPQIRSDQHVNGTPDVSLFQGNSALATHTQTMSSSSSGLPELTVVSRPVLQCTEAHCGRVYSCLGNLNRHRKVAHGICAKRDKLPLH